MFQCFEVFFLCALKMQTLSAFRQTFIARMQLSQSTGLFTKISRTHVRIRYSRILLFICIACILYMYQTYRKTVSTSEFFASTKKVTPKWIVVVATKDPSKYIEELSRHPDWTLLAVESSPGALADWRMEDTHFLPHRDHPKLGFGGYENARNRSDYAVLKNLGFLYAVRMGAEWIYDIDEDWQPNGLSLDQFDFQEQHTGLRFQTPDSGEFDTGKKVFNAFEFFGDNKRWPFGFPTDYVHNHTNDEAFFRLCQRNRRAAIQHAMTVELTDTVPPKGLLHHKLSGSLPATYNRFTPPITIAPGTYAPFGSNTLFHYSAFSSLFLPPSGSRHISEALRAVFASKMLLLTDEALSILPPNQVRNTTENGNWTGIGAHEREFYESIDEMLAFSNGWICGEKKLWRCLRKLGNEFVQHNFWPADSSVEQWLHDLKSTGYKLPALRLPSRLYALHADDKTEKEMVNCRRAQLQLTTDLPPLGSDAPATGRVQQKMRDMGELLEWCSATDGLHGFDQNYTLPSHLRVAEEHHANQVLRDRLDTVLVITHNYRFTFGIGLLQRLYQQYFGLVIFCGAYDKEHMNNDLDTKFPPMRKPFNYIRISEQEVHIGHQGYLCVSKAAELRLPNVKGFFFMSDDMIFNVWQPTDLKKANVATEHYNTILNWENRKGRNQTRNIRRLANVKYRNDSEVRRMEEQFAEGLAANRYDQRVQNRFKANTFDDMIVAEEGWAHSDWVYIPQSNMSFARVALQLFWEGRLFHEIALSKLTLALPTKFQECRINYIWWHRRFYWWEMYREDYIGVHPIKMNEFVQPPEMKARFCTLVVDAFHRNLFTSHKAKTEVDCTGYDYWFYEDMAIRIFRGEKNKELGAKYRAEEEVRRAQDLRETIDLEKEWGITRKRF